jgi:hypothetical protein
VAFLHFLEDTRSPFYFFFDEDLDSFFGLLFVAYWTVESLRMSGAMCGLLSVLRLVSCRHEDLVDEEGRGFCSLLQIWIMEERSWARRYFAPNFSMIESGRLGVAINGSDARGDPSQFQHVLHRIIMTLAKRTQETKRESSGSTSRSRIDLFGRWPRRLLSCLPRHSTPSRASSYNSREHPVYAQRRDGKQCKRSPVVPPFGHTITITYDLSKLPARNTLHDQKTSGEGKDMGPKGKSGGWV